MGAASGAMNRGGKTSWKAIQIQGPIGARALDAAERLAALYRFQNGEGPADLRFVAVTMGTAPPNPVSDPADVDWDTFPVLAALEAVTRDELRRLRTLIAMGGPQRSPQTPPIDELTPQVTLEAPRPPAWGLDLGKPASTEA